MTTNYKWCSDDGVTWERFKIGTPVTGYAFVQFTPPRTGKVFGESEKDKAKRLGRDGAFIDNDYT